MPERVPFEEAIAHPKLMKPLFDKSSLPQQVALKVIYGLRLSEKEKEIWAILQGGAVYDELGYPEKVTPIDYYPREYNECWMVLGRRSGKTDRISSLIVTYEAVLGGHEEYIRKGAQYASCFLIAQDLKNARNALNLIKANLNEAEWLKEEIEGEPTADTIKLKNGTQITVSPPNAKHVRGSAAAVVVMDEVGMWYTDSESANPDFEIERAAKFAQLQFPHYKRIGTSTPWTKEGLLYHYHSAGTLGCKIQNPEDRLPFRDLLVLHAPTPAMQNPLINKKFFEAEFAKDREAYEREILANFVDSISGFLNSDLIRSSVDKGVKERPPVKGNYYIAAMDPAFRRDSFAFTIMHSDPKIGIVQDVVRCWTAEHGIPLNPAVILAEIAPLLQQYKIPVVYSDQHQLESLQQLALNMGFAIEGVDFTSKSKAKIYGSLQQVVNQKRIRLLDNVEQVTELIQLERKLTPLGGVQISAPPNRHDDLAAVIAIAAYKSVWLLPLEPPKPKTDPTLFDQCMAQIKRKKFGERRDQFR